MGAHCKSSATKNSFDNMSLDFMSSIAEFPLSVDNGFSNISFIIKLSDYSRCTLDVNGQSKHLLKEFILQRVIIIFSCYATVSMSLSSTDPHLAISSSHGLNCLNCVHLELVSSPQSNLYIRTASHPFLVMLPLPRSNPAHPPTRSLQSVSFTAFLCTISA